MFQGKQRASMKVLSAAVHSSKAEQTSISVVSNGASLMSIAV